MNGYNPERDCELDAAFHICWHYGADKYAGSVYPDVIAWAKALYPEQHAKLSAAFKTSVRKVLG